MRLQYIDDRLYFRALRWCKVACVDFLNRGGISRGSSKNCQGKNLCAKHGYCGPYDALPRDFKRFGRKSRPIIVYRFHVTNRSGINILCRVGRG